MLRAGLAFIYPPTGSEAKLAEMRKAEQDARQNKRGIWADAAYADIAADNAESHEGHFAFVTGKIVDAARVKNKVYLNFGPDWHDDFTVTIAAHDLRSFKQAGLDPLSPKDKTVRVRGWLERDSGPAMTVTTPWQIEILH